MSGRLKGRAVVVTGATSGLGLGVAQRVVAEGGTVFLAARDEQRLEGVTRTLGVRAVPVRCDVTVAADLDRLFATVKDRVGHLDGVVANAGAPTLLGLGQYEHEAFDRALALNVKGIAFTVQGAMPLLADEASVVLMSSIEGLRGVAGLGIYAATKAAQQSFARTWANELRGRRIRVNAVSPGPVYTPAFEHAGVKLDDLEPVIQDIPAGRLGTAEDVAQSVAFLLSQESTWVNGANLVVDGGQTAIV